ncbi:MAG TPA: glycosyltransferase family 2 protein [Acidimicrobiales bacterium]|jgi:glycosyltransferase involved in cell wall biosynthesis|nr:glycosyltransferase family 2 protein [Acidimicrobiales bacterium]
MDARSARRRRALDELVDTVALEEFERAHGMPCLPAVVVVIAAYKERENIGSVMEELPETICDLPAAAIVVIDGEDDGASAIVRKAGQYAVIAPVNRGQGAALRLGYRVARTFGATYIVTADGDGQADPSDLATILGPVVAGEADFVSGSRRLGETHNDDPLRNLGVIVFGKIISILMRTHVTDTANPVRAMRAELSGRLTLDEPQYQASELLISAVASGARYAERPVTFRKRSGGTSKKGGNLLYGFRYAKVLSRTFWRETKARREK